ncbi:undecaprenyl-diphosphatase [Paraburkholderia caballeronis]|uniref:bifunctional DedA family/phosphatase PAP2 family protein n=1 Tax=Paraburkholderia caballeronis TaxID=416943 RepID=UPI0010647ECD|nr:bifunctional DedA family/phosphatase PAP2 family protein [Paraburkholderia caballeronis]TDV34324.1 undecaprenyl-diphosphatase [Paraburkholderia caballeronis]
MEHAYAQLLHLLAAHPGWTLAFVFAAAFLESLALIGTFIPGSSAMFVAGAFVGTGTLNLGWLFAFAISGAVAGDGLSYWVGRRYRDALHQLWPFCRHPGLLTAAKQYFARHGARSVIFARFIAPLRAVVPVVAGMVGMSPMRFFVMNVVSALIWAPAHILPGVVFGASLQLAGAVSFRLVAVLAIFAAAGWLIFRVSRIVLSHADAWASASRQRAARWAAQHHGATARRLARLLDPAQPALGAVVVLTGLVPVCAAIFSYVLGNVLRGDPLVQVDQSVRQFLYSIRTTWADTLLARIETLGSAPALIALMAAVTVWMAVERRWRTIAYWLIAAAFSQLLILAIRVVIHHTPADDGNLDAFVFPSDRVASMVIVYGFVMFLLVRRVSRWQVAVAVATAGNAIIVAFGFAGLYFDRFLFSDAVGGAAFASIWVAVVVLTSLWRYPDHPPSRNFMPLAFAGVLAAALVLQPVEEPRAGGMAARGADEPLVLTRLQWTDTSWKTFACYRVDMKGGRREPMTIQWAASAADLSAALRDAGWTKGPQFTAHGLLSLVSPQVNATALPILPKLNNGVPSPLVFARAHLPDDPAHPGARRDVLRFWPSGYALLRNDGRPPATIWVGTLVYERLRRPSWPFNVLVQYAGDQERPIAGPNGPPGWQAVVMPASEGCEERPVTLLVPDDRR